MLMKSFRCPFYLFCKCTLSCLHGELISDKLKKKFLREFKRLKGYKKLFFGFAELDNTECGKSEKD